MLFRAHHSQVCYFLYKCHSNYPTQSSFQVPSLWWCEWQQSGTCRHIIISIVYWPTRLLPRQVICIVKPFIYHTQLCSAYHARPMRQMDLPKAPATGGQLGKQEHGNLSCRASPDLGLISLNIYSQGQLVTIVRREWGECANYQLSPFSTTQEVQFCQGIVVYMHVVQDQLPPSHVSVLYLIFQCPHSAQILPTWHQANLVHTI